MYNYGSSSVNVKPSSKKSFAIYNQSCLDLL